MAIAHLARMPVALAGDGPGLRAALDEHGFCAVRAVASSAELAALEALFFEWLEAAPALAGARAAPARVFGAADRGGGWRALGYENTGVLCGRGLGQSTFLWGCRMLPAVRGAFADAWGLPEAAADNAGGRGPGGRARLLTSFDGAGAHRNPFLEGARANWRIAPGWFHLDQVSADARARASERARSPGAPDLSLSRPERRDTRHAPPRAPGPAQLLRGRRRVGLDRARATLAR